MLNTLSGNFTFDNRSFFCYFSDGWVKKLVYTTGRKPEDTIAQAAVLERHLGVVSTVKHEDPRHA